MKERKRLVSRRSAGGGGVWGVTHSRSCRHSVTNLRHDLSCSLEARSPRLGVSRARAGLAQAPPGCADARGPAARLSPHLAHLLGRWSLLHLILT